MSIDITEELKTVLKGGDPAFGLRPDSAEIIMKHSAKRRGEWKEDEEKGN